MPLELREALGDKSLFLQTRNRGTFLVVQRKTELPMQGAQVQSLVRELGAATKSLHATTEDLSCCNLRPGTVKFFFFKGFPGSPVVKNLPVCSGDTGLIPGPGRSHIPRGN